MVKIEFVFVFARVKGTFSHVMTHLDFMCSYNIIHVINNFFKEKT